MFANALGLLVEGVTNLVVSVVDGGVSRIVADLVSLCITYSTALAGVVFVY